MEPILAIATYFLYPSDYLPCVSKSVAESASIPSANCCLINDYCIRLKACPIPESKLRSITTMLSTHSSWSWGWSPTFWAIISSTPCSTLLLRYSLLQSSTCLIEYHQGCLKQCSSCCFLSVVLLRQAILCVLTHHNAQDAQETADIKAKQHFVMAYCSHQQESILTSCTAFEQGR